MKRLPIVGLLMLLSLIVATSAAASTRAMGEHPRLRVVISPDPVSDGPESPAVNAARPADSAQKATPANRKISANQEIGDGCIEYVIFGTWHVWVGSCGCSGSGSGSGSTSGGGCGGGW